MKRTFALALVAAAVTAAGCGGGSNNSSSSSSGGASGPPPKTKTSAAKPAPAGGGANDLKISADPSGQLKFDTSSLKAKSGKVTITMANPSSIPHGVAIEGNGVDKDGQVVNHGGTSTVSAKLKPGKYTFYCPVPGHRQAGMEGTLTVK